MSEFTVQSESIDVEQIMERIRQRIREKRDEDYTEDQIRELAHVKLERFLDPTSIRSDMVSYYRKRLKEREAAIRNVPEAPTSYEFDPEIVFRSSRGFLGRVLYRIRKLSSPFIKIFFNPAPILHALTVQQQINERQAEVISQMVRTHAEFIEIAALNYEVMHNLVVEMTRLSIEMKNHRMRVESIAGRLDFDERRARALETVVQYREGAGPTGSAVADTGDTESGGADRRRRRRRRGRRRPTGASGEPSTTREPGNGDTVVESAPPAASTGERPRAETEPRASASTAAERTGPRARAEVSRAGSPVEGDTREAPAEPPSPSRSEDPSER